MSGLTPRRLGRSGVALSPIALGSMRLAERGLDDAAWDALLRASIELGVTTLHSSSEYESYPRWCSLLARLPARHRLQHIVKLAEPHFGDAGFDPARLTARVDGYLTGLGAERLDVLQWMWRGDLADEPGRLRGLLAARAELAGAFAALRAAGKLGAVAPFPYTAGFADAALDAGVFDGLTVYLNPVERELVPQIDRAAASGLGTIAIRPLAAGKALAAASPADCMRAVLGHPGVACAVVSYSSRDHLHVLASALPP